MLKKGDVVCVGFSGGADSTCLLLLLLDIKDVLGIEVEAFHVNHNLRGAQSDADQAFAEQFCKERNVKLNIFSHDIKEISNEMKLGLEEAGRIKRREDAIECLKRGCTKIALAHHKNDQAETVIFNMTRGSSLSGITGIKPVNGKFIHPMLEFERSEIEEECKKRCIAYVCDSTNTDTLYSRNYIRHEILNGLSKNINSMAVSHIADLAVDSLLVWNLIDDLSNKAYDKYVISDGNELLIKSAICTENPFIISIVVKKAIEKLSGKKKDVKRKHINDVCELINAKGAKKVSLPFEMTAVSSYFGIRIRKNKDISYKYDKEIKLIPGTAQTFLNFTIISKIVKVDENFVIEKNKYTKCFDYDKINDSCVFRTRRMGDCITIGYENSKKIKNYFIDEKIERDQRDSIPLMAIGSEVLWIVGYRMGDAAKISESTRTALVVSVRESLTKEI